MVYVAKKNSKSFLLRKSFHRTHLHWIIRSVASRYQLIKEREGENMCKIVRDSLKWQSEDVDWMGINESLFHAFNISLIFLVYNIYKTEQKL